MLKNSKAITLITLIITIIVLLILAGVTINMVLGDNGIINKSKSSMGKYEDSASKELEFFNQVQNYKISGNRNDIPANSLILFSNNEDIRNWIGKLNPNTIEVTAENLLNINLLQLLMNSEEAVNYMLTNENIMNLVLDNKNAVITLGKSDIALNKVFKNSMWRNAIFQKSTAIQGLEESGIVSKLTKNERLTSNTETANSKVTSSSYYNESDGIYPPYKAFDGTWTWQNSWISSRSQPISSSVNPYLIYQFKNKSIVPFKFIVMGADVTDNAVNGQAYIQASKDGITYNTITASFNLPPTQKVTIYPNQNIDEYSFFKVVVTKETGNYQYKKAIISDWEIYGIE